MLAELVEVVKRDADGVESNLIKLNLRLSPAAVTDILCALNDLRLPALRFFKWVLNYHVDFKPTSDIYNLYVDNLGRSEDYSTIMCCLIFPLKGVV
ncbi:hypothetical protein AXF42_Ash007695 [Apostasia shenzhenica]|uniref:Pentatricopeptide repeat-containing protein n=1 Tax=Apostasia shenzhenica TaxID=1088818 RepID=A0A2I0A665_9ASPA|nr:hypothetical protein AXF42_Ash007695 [Apostasia shenzhenica]